MVAGGGVKAGERLSLVTLAVNIEHDAVPHCSNAHQAHTGHRGREGKMGSGN